MIPKYRKRAGIILLVSLTLLVAFFSARRFFKTDQRNGFERVTVVVIVALGCLYVYGCYTLIKATGQSSALLLIAAPFVCIAPFGALIAPLAVAIAVPDRHPQGNVRKRRRFLGWMERRGRN